MPKIPYNKLVRDKIPQIIEESGKTCNWKMLSEEQYIKRLREKLLEEAKEYFDNGTVEELADIVEVIYTILEYDGISIDELERVRLEKRDSRGGFCKRIFLKDVTE